MKKCMSCTPLQRYVFALKYNDINKLSTCNDLRKNASYICTITLKGLMNLKLSLESLIKPSFT